jgi:hypothetical protein
MEDGWSTSWGFRVLDRLFLHRDCSMRPVWCSKMFILLPLNAIVSLGVNPLFYFS